VQFENLKKKALLANCAEARAVFNYIRHLEDLRKTDKEILEGLKSLALLAEQFAKSLETENQS
jgi:hypothetical protein